MSKEKIKFSASSVVKAEDEKEIEMVAKKRGIKYPSVHLGFFKTIYCEIENANRNNVRLSREAIEQALQGLIGCQTNFEHNQAGFICGSILDAWINQDDQVEVVYSFFKSVYPEEYERSVELAQEGKLSVSFELLADRDTQEYLADGTRRLNDVEFVGMGHLMDNDPACPIAKVYEFANRVKRNLEKIDQEEFVFASKIKEQCDEVLKEEPKNNILVVDFQDNEAVINAHKILANLIAENKNEKTEENTLTEEQLKQIQEIRAELGEIASDVSDEDLLNEEKLQELRSKLEPTEEVIEDDVEDDVKEEAVEDETEDAEVEEARKTDVVEIRTFTYEEKDGVETIVESVDRIEKTDWNAMQEAQAQLQSKDEEIESLKAELEAKDQEIANVREETETITVRKLELQDNPYVAEFEDKDYLNDEKLERAKEKAEFDRIKAENEELKKAQVEQTEEKVEAKVGEESNESIDFTDVIDASVAQYKQNKV